MSQQVLRQHLRALLTEPNAHAMINDLLNAFPQTQRGTKVTEQVHTAWQLLEHLRICQYDILEFSRNPKYVSPPFPDGLWPDGPEPPSDEAWDRSVAEFNRDLEQMLELITEESNDLLIPIAHGDGQTLLREALVLAKHNSYHLGQLALLKTYLE